MSLRFILQLYGIVHISARTKCFYLTTAHTIFHPLYINYHVQIICIQI